MENVLQTVISQYGNSPTLLALIEYFDQYIDPSTDIDTFYSYVWNVDTAQGFGLDIWGRIVNIPRVFNVPADTPNPGGFSFTPGAYALTDDQYRKLILTKALANIINATPPALNALLSSLFTGRGRCYVIDLGGMAIRIVCEFYLQPFEYVALTTYGVSPRPSGVLLSIVQGPPDGTFGFAEGVQFQPFNYGTFFNVS